MQAYLSSAKASPQAWELCLQRFDASSYVEVKFWCIQSLRELVNSSYRSLSPAAQLQVWWEYLVKFVFLGGSKPRGGEVLVHTEPEGAGQQQLPLAAAAGAAAGEVTSGG